MLVNAKISFSALNTIEELGYWQPKTPMQVNNLAAERMANDKIVPKWTKEMDVNFDWLHDRKSQGKLQCFLKVRTETFAGYWTKNHSWEHHTTMHPEFVTQLYKSSSLWESLRCKTAKAG